MDTRVELVESSDPLVMEGGIKTRTVSRVIMTSFEGRYIRFTAALEHMRRPWHQALQEST
jgi:hypothetical protein